LSRNEPHLPGPTRRDESHSSCPNEGITELIQPTFGTTIDDDAYSRTLAIACRRHYAIRPYIGMECLGLNTEIFGETIVPNNRRDESHSSCPNEEITELIQPTFGKTIGDDAYSRTLAIACRRHHAIRPYTGMECLGLNTEIFGETIVPNNRRDESHSSCPNEGITELIQPTFGTTIGDDAYSRTNAIRPYGLGIRELNTDRLAYPLIHHLTRQAEGTRVGDFDLHQFALELANLPGEEGQSVGAGAAHDLGWVLGVGGFDEDFLDPIGVALGALSGLG
jgi:hypothetical protein